MAAGAAFRQDKTFELRLSHGCRRPPLQKHWDWGSSIEKASNGTINTTVYPSQQLGKAFDHYDMARDGSRSDLCQPRLSAGRFRSSMPATFR